MNPVNSTALKLLKSVAIAAAVGLLLLAAWRSFEHRYAAIAIVRGKTSQFQDLLAKPEFLSELAARMGNTDSASHLRSRVVPMPVRDKAVMLLFTGSSANETERLGKTFIEQVRTIRFPNAMERRDLENRLWGNQYSFDRYLAAANREYSAFAAVSDSVEKNHLPTPDEIQAAQGNLKYFYNLIINLEVMAYDIGRIRSRLAGSDPDNVILPLQAPTYQPWMSVLYLGAAAAIPGFFMIVRSRRTKRTA